MFDSFANKKFSNTNEKFGNGEFSSLDKKDLVESNQVPNFNLYTKNNFIIIAGPTGVGKSDFAEYLINNVGHNATIINGDMGQLYTPLSIGTSKPENISNCSLFNMVNEPVNLGAYAFRSMVIESLNACWSQGKLPIIVGGSGFYIKSLFYSPAFLEIPKINDDLEMIEEFKNISAHDLYLELKKIDPQRAEQIHPHDRYRIERALFLWNKTLHKPSQLRPEFRPLGSCFYYFLTRQKQELKNRIDQRIEKMFEIGWLDEVKSLDDSWKSFLLKKKLIGYPEIIRYLEGGNTDQKNLIEIIGFKTSQYAKRQLTFWRSLNKELIESDPKKQYIRDIQEFDLTNNFECLKNIIIKKINES